MAKIIEFDAEARAALKRGVDQLAEAVRVTLGPKGRNVLIDKKFGAPTITKDGVTVAKEVELEDPIENMGAQMVKEVASKTNDLAGDGTTTATVLAQAIVKEGLKNVAAGANPMDLKHGIDLAVETVITEIQSQSQVVGSKLDKIKQVAGGCKNIIIALLRCSLFRRYNCTPVHLPIFAEGEFISALGIFRCFRVLPQKPLCVIRPVVVTQKFVAIAGIERPSRGFIYFPGLDELSGVRYALPVNLDCHFLPPSSIRPSFPGPRVPESPWRAVLSAPPNPFPWPTPRLPEW